MDLGRLLRPRSVAVVGATERPGVLRRRGAAEPARLGYRRARLRRQPAAASRSTACRASALADAAGGARRRRRGDPRRATRRTVVERGGRARLRRRGRVRRGLRRGAPAARRCRTRWSRAARAPRAAGLRAQRQRHRRRCAGRVALWGDMVAPREPRAASRWSRRAATSRSTRSRSRRGLRLHTVVSCGNQAVLGAADFARGAGAQRDGVRSVALYLEDDGDGARWCAALERCARAGIGVAVLKAGARAAGAAAAQAHTGALAGDQRAFRALVEECGAAWATRPARAARAGQGARGPRAPARRRGVAVMTCSGGDAASPPTSRPSSARRCRTCAEQTVARLDALLPDAATARTRSTTRAAVGRARGARRARARAGARTPPSAACWCSTTSPPARRRGGGLVGGRARRRSAAGAREHDVPVLVGSTLPELLDDATAAGLQSDGHRRRRRPAHRAALRGRAERRRPRDPARIAAIARGARCAAGDGGSAGSPSTRPRPCCATRASPSPTAGSSPTRTTPSPRGRGSAARSRSSCPRAGLRHKPSAAPCCVGLERRARRAQGRARAARCCPRATRRRCSSRRMAPAGRRAARRRARRRVVPVLVVGLGGVWTEALDDVRVLPLPATAERVEQALRSLRGARCSRARAAPRRSMSPPRRGSRCAPRSSPSSAG